MANRTYTAEQRTEAVALSLAIGPLAAAKQLGIPHRTVSAWRRGERRGGELQPVVRLNQEQLAERMWDTLERAVRALESRLDDPNARVGDLARATEVLVTSHALLSGQATSRTEKISKGIDASLDTLSLAEQEQVALLIQAAAAQQKALGRLTPERRAELVARAESLYREFYGPDLEAVALLPPQPMAPAAPVAEPPPTADDIAVLRAWLAEQDAKAGAS